MSLPSSRKSWPPLNLPATARVESSTMRSMAMRSSTTRVPNTPAAKDFLERPISEKLFTTTMVLDMLRRPARKMLSMGLQLMACPSRKPITNTPRNLLPAVTRADVPAPRSFLKLNSRPRPNIRKMIPIWLQSSTVSMLLIPNTPICGPMMKPAIMYPSMVGCLSARQIMVMIPAEMRITARSRTKLTSSLIKTVQNPSNLHNFRKLADWN